MKFKNFFIAAIFLGSFKAHLTQQNAGEGIASIMALPFVTTFCPCMWPGLTITGLGVTVLGGATTGAGVAVGSAASMSISVSGTSGTSSGSCTTTTVDLNNGNVPFSDTNLYEYLEEQEESRYTGRFTKGCARFLKVFFMSPAYVEKKRQKKADKKAAKDARKNKKNVKEEVIEEIDLTKKEPEVQATIICEPSPEQIEKLNELSSQGLNSEKEIKMDVPCKVVKGEA